MSVSITVRHVPDETRDVLAARAARAGQSLQEHLLQELQRMALRPSVEDWLADARAVAADAPALSADDIVAGLDADRR